jgi:hypothetical protein
MNLLVARLLLRLLKGQHAMALKVDALNAAVDRNTKAVDALVASHSDPAVAALDVASKKAEDAVAPPVAG